MKVKVKFDQAQLKSFFIQHGEKIVFGLFVMTFCWLSWRALGVKPYGKAPDQLQKASAEASNKIENSTPPNPIPGLAAAPNFDRLHENGGVPPVDGTPYLLASPWSRPLAERRVRRVEPKFLAPRQLLAYAEFGVFAISRTSVGRSTGLAKSGAMPGSDEGMGGRGPQGMGRQGMGRQGMGPQGMGPQGMGPGMGKGTGSMPSGMPGAVGKGKGSTRKDKDAEKKKKAKEKADKEKEEARLAAKKRRENEKHDLLAPSGSKLKGRYWVCIVGLVPTREQFAEYSKVFRDATHTDEFLDVPHWREIEVQRAEVTSPGQEVNDNDWQDSDVPAAWQEIDKWPEYPELVDEQYIEQDVCEPLPPVVSRNLRLESVCHPKIVELSKAKPLVTKVAAKKKTKSRDIGRGGMSGSMGGMPGMGGGRGMSEMGQGMGPMGSMPGMSGYGASKAPRVEYRLCRFFDLDVEPGKTYRYRIRLVLWNPNYDVPPRYLQSKNAQKLREGTTRTTDWCEACPPVTVPLGGSVLAGEVKRPKGNKDPSIEFLLNLFDKGQGVDTVYLMDMRRGDVANSPATPVPVPNLAVPDSAPVEKTLDIETGTLLIDLAGGDKVPGTPGTTPGRALLMSPTGELIIRSEARDAARLTDDKNRLAEMKQLMNKEVDQKNREADDGGFNFGAFEKMNPGDSKKKGRRK